MNSARPQAAGRAAKLADALRGLSPRISNITTAAAGGGGGGLESVELWAVLDPLSKTAQRVAPVLEFLHRTLRPTIKARQRFDLRCPRCIRQPSVKPQMGLISQHNQ